jgi:DNA-binding Lrp family transcriptional regulator
LNADLLGKTLTVFINITIKDHQLKSREKFLANMRELDDLVELYHTSGTYDFLAKVRFTNIYEYRNFLVNKVSCIDNISEIDSQIVLEEIYSTTKVILK